MKIGNRCLVAAAVTALITAVAKPAGAQPAPPGPVVTFNEFGNITIGGVPGPLGLVLLEAFSGLPTLTYTLPFPAVIGDIFLFELPPGGQPFSDLLRFLPNPLNPGSTLLYVFSDATAADPPDPGDLADHFVIPAQVPGLIFIFLPETGPEDGVNGLFGYVAPPGTPGFVAGANPTYNFISDTPEPGSLLLMATGGVSVLWWRRRTRANRAAA